MKEIEKIYFEDEKFIVKITISKNNRVATLIAKRFEIVDRFLENVVVKAIHDHHCSAWGRNTIKNIGYEKLKEAHDILVKLKRNEFSELVRDISTRELALAVMAI